jgi:hypothetical protein
VLLTYLDGAVQRLPSSSSGTIAFCVPHNNHCSSDVLPIAMSCWYVTLLQLELVLSPAPFRVPDVQDVVRAGKHNALHYLMGLDRYIIRLQELRGGS